MYPIEKGVPIPESATSSKYPFASMGIGTSFVAPYEKHLSLRSLASSSGRRLRRKFVARRDGESIRVWRVK